MVIDFHAHIYPEKIAAKASKSVGEFYDIPIEYDGSAETLLKNGKKIGVEHYIVHSTATKPTQVESINNFILDECAKHSEFVGFGTIHQNYENYEAELKRIKEAGLKGIKLHPDFQQFQIDTPLMDGIYDVIARLEMPVLVHAGDCRYDFSGPKRIRNLIERHPDLIVIAAHFGGYSEWKNAKEYLVGQNVYFDTSSSLWKLDKQEAVDMIHKHGVEKMFFGTDYPMWDHEEEFERLMSLGLSQEENEMILWKNAAKLLKL